MSEPAGQPSNNPPDTNRIVPGNLARVDRLPGGTVTLLFSDVEGSTQLLLQLKAQYATLQAEHQRLLRRVFAQHDGHEVDTQGDSFLVVFARATQAVAA